jgi:DNA topoisomerase VI subunit B
VNTLQRTTFSTSRLLEFFSAKELQMQIGHGRDQWPIALLKELLDNALDACETADIAPVIKVVLEDDAVSVQDNGPGLPIETLEKSLDYTVRVSDKLHYVSPSRGQLGNALKCVWAAPFVAGGNEHGRVEIISNGKRHTIDVRLDRIAQEPKIGLETSPDDTVKTGTFIKMHWSGIAGYLRCRREGRFYGGGISACDLVLLYSHFNPHAHFEFRGIDVEGTFEPSASDWSKWSPRSPTSPHWYTGKELQNLISAYIAEERNGGEAKTIRQFVAEFKGLSGTRKQKEIAERVDGEYLHDLVKNGSVDYLAVNELLWAMQEESRRVSPRSLGIVGEEHFQSVLKNQQVDDIEYAKKTGTVDDMPYVLEVAFGVKTSGTDNSVLVGLNWSPTLKGNIFDVMLSRTLDKCLINASDPITLLIHLACPKLEFEDRGKSILTLPVEIRDDLRKAIKKVTKDWTAYKKRLRREQQAELREWERRQKAAKRRKLNIKDAAFEVMEEAYMNASAGGTLPANARQIMYAARPSVLKLTDGKVWKNSSYFTQHLLPEYLDTYPQETEDWDVVYDARGTIAEPHREIQVDLGTLEVRGYIAGWETDFKTQKPLLSHQVKTVGPVNRYEYVLFVEKEGFNPLLEATQIAEKWDIAIMSTKGMSVTASRRLVDELSQKGVIILVIRDFDKAGFSIVHTLSHDTERYQFEARPNVVDLGLRLADVQAMGLESEEVKYTSKINPRRNLLESGATDSEADFLVRGGSPKRYWGHRVELNAMTSDRFVKWLEAKLKGIGVEKIIPDQEVLEKAYRRAKLIAEMQEVIDKAYKDFDLKAVEVPGNLSQQVEEKIQGKSDAWDDAIWKLAKERQEAAND